MKTAAEFWENVKIGEPDACWEWTRAKARRGYGSVYWLGRDHKAHRVAYALTHTEENISGVLICHRCDNPPCCNPKHLFAGTSLDNVRDRFAKNRFVGEEAPNVRFTKEDVYAIRHSYDALGATIKELTERYGCSQGAIRHIVHRETWKSLPEVAA